MILPDTDTLSAPDIIRVANIVGIELPLSKQSIGRINRAWKMYRGEGHVLQGVGSYYLVARLGKKNPIYYSVDNRICTCMDFITRGEYCKHQIYLALRNYDGMKETNISPTVPSIPRTVHRRTRRIKTG